MTTFKRIFFGIWALLFLLFAYWQWNDPDPLLWISIYGYGALMALLAAFGRYHLPLLLFGIFFGLAGFLYLYPGAIGHWIAQEWQQQGLSMKTQHMEEAREAFGLLIVSTILGIATFLGWKLNRQSGLNIKDLKSKPI